jgi:hypothetical protein
MWIDKWTLFKMMLPRMLGTLALLVVIFTAIAVVPQLTEGQAGRSYEERQTRALETIARELQELNRRERRCR